VAFEYDVYFSERPRNRVVRWSPDSGDVEIVAGEPPDGDETQKLADPYGLAFDRDGHLLVADKLNHRICRLVNGRLKAMSLRDVTGHRARRPDTAPGYDPTLRCPTGLWLEPEGSILCTFSDDYVIYRILPKGELELVLGIPRNRPYHFSGLREVVPLGDVAITPLDIPTGIVARPDGTLFFVERRPQVVREYHQATGLRCVFPVLRQHHPRTHEAPDEACLGEFNVGWPASIALDADQRLYVCDTWYGCILRVEPALDRVTKVLQFDDHFGADPAGPVALGFGPDGTAWVVDSVQSAVEAYETTQVGRWRKTGVRLTQVRGQKLSQYPSAGTSVVFGRPLGTRSTSRSKARR
jgi:sugar lactone lactonase YvrE